MEKTITTFEFTSNNEEFQRLANNVDVAIKELEAFKFQMQITQSETKTSPEILDSKPE